MPRLVRLGMLVGLSQALLKVASPGVPDYYQGTELWDFSLVDPDNRRPVDFELRKKLLRGRKRRPSAEEPVRRAGEAARHPRGPGGAQEIPAALPRRALHAALRRRRAWRRRSALSPCAMRTDAVIAVAPRLFASLMQEGDLAPIGEKIWRESRLVLPQGEYTEVMTGRKHRRRARGRMAELLAEFPVALLVSRP